MNNDTDNLFLVNCKLKYIILPILLFLVNPNNLCSQTKRTFINPGVKIGYAFGNGGGLVMGFECSFSSITFDTHTSSYGFVVGIDKYFDFTKYHIGVEYYYGGIGLEYGPSYLKKGEEFDITTSATLYTWLIAIPYASITFNNEFGAFNEYGMFLKFPIQLSGPDFRQ